MGELDRLQRAMVDALGRGGTADEVRAALLAQDWSPEVATWIAAWDDRATRAAISLSARWSRFDGR